MTAIRRLVCLALAAASCLLAGCSSEPTGAGPTGAGPTGAGPAGAGPTSSTAAARSAAPAPTHPGLAYAKVSPAQVLDLWLPSRAGQAPLVIFIHGGGFAEGDKAEVGGKVRPLLAAGFAVASINYRLSGEAPFPAGARDAKAAVRFLRANAAAYDLDPGRFAVWGQSAGGNLAALVGLTGDQRTVLDDDSLGHAPVSSAVHAVVDWYGPTDLTLLSAQATQPPSRCATPQTATAEGYSRAYLGGELPAVGAQAAQANPISYVPAATTVPAFAIAHGTGDCLVAVGQSQLLDGALRARGVRPDLRILDGATHGDPRFDAELMAPTIAWLATALRG